MSNLATMIMEGSNYGFGRANLTHSYGHEDGAGLIAMESAEALRDIFEAEFYVPNTCTIAAALEGASCVEESSQAAIMEASLKGAFQKIKDFFIKLKEKVKDFLHNIIRYLKSIFVSDAKWVTQYEKELKALKSADLKDYEVKMYNYTIDEAMSKDKLIEQSDKLLNKAKDYIDGEISKQAGRGEGITQDEIDSDVLDETFDNMYLEFIKGELKKSVDADEVQKALWSKYRGGAESESDKDDIAVGPNITNFIDTIKKSTKMIEAYNTAITKTDKMYNTAIKFVNETEQKMNKLDYKTITMNDGSKRDETKLTYNKEHEGVVDGRVTKNSTRTASRVQVGNITATLRKYSSYLSKMQSFKNSDYTAAKTAITERSGAYKKALVGAFGYAKKNKKK